MAHDAAADVTGPTFHQKRVLTAMESSVERLILLLSPKSAVHFEASAKSRLILIGSSYSCTRTKPEEMRKQVRHSDAERNQKHKENNHIM